MAARAYIRFTNVEVEQYALIESAYLRVTSYHDITDSIDVNVYLAAEANPSRPNSKAQLDSVSVTGGVNWNITEAWENNSDYYSPNISAGIQDIVNMDNWQSGNSMMIIIENNGSSNSRRFYSFESGQGAGLGFATLEITSTEPIPTATPVFNPLGAKFESGAQSVSITSSTAGADIYYTTDTTTPALSSSKYTTPITISSDFTLKAVAFKSGGGYTLSGVKSDDYSIYQWTLDQTFTDPIAKMTIYNGNIWASDNAGKVWLYGPTTNYTWSNQGGVYDLPNNSGPTMFEAVDGSLYASQNDYMFYKYSGGWSLEGDFTLTQNPAGPLGLNMKVTGLLNYNSDTFITGVGSGWVWIKNPGEVATLPYGWDVEYTTSGYNTQDIIEYNGEIFVTANPPSFIYKRDSLGSWSQSFYTNSMRRARRLLEGSDGYLYCSFTKSDTGQYHSIYQYNGSSWAIVVGVDDISGQDPVMCEHGGYIYSGGSGLGDSDLYRFPLDPIRGQENATLFQDLTNMDVNAMISFNNSLFVATRTNTGNGEVYVYN